MLQIILRQLIANTIEDAVKLGKISSLQPSSGRYIAPSVQST